MKKDQELVLDNQSETIVIYRETEDPDEENLYIIWWDEEEWLEDPKNVVPAITYAIELFYTNQVKLLKLVNMEEHIL